MRSALDVAVLVLAAGNASRMGYAKQLLPFNGRSFIRNAVNTARIVAGDNCFVVVGAYHEAIENDLKATSCKIIVHKDWARGMGSSLKAGLKAIQAQHPAVKGAIILVADQPFVNKDLLLQLLDEQLTSGKKIVACQYQETCGTPVLFMRPYFEQLLALADEAGAKKLLKQNAHDVAFVDFPQGAIDIDTEDDYKKLQRL